jgi:4-amino-4-deoxychorismate lyase
MSREFLETIKILDGEVFNIEYHQKRYEDVLKAHDIELVHDLKSFIEPPSFGLYRCRLTYDLDKDKHDIKTSYHQYKKQDINTLKLVFDNDIAYKHKSTCRDDLDRLYEQKGDADDILIIKNLLVSDTSKANIAFYTNGAWVTPKEPLLKGTTRQRLIDEGKLLEVDIKVQDIRKFSKVALLNAMIDFDILESCEFLI